MEKINEETWKNCMRMREVATKAIKGAETLDDKLRMTKLQRMLDECDRNLKLICFEYEDAVKFAEGVERCEECGSI